MSKSSLMRKRGRRKCTSMVTLMDMDTLMETRRRSMDTLMETRRRRMAILICIHMEKRKKVTLMGIHRQKRIWI